MAPFGTMKSSQQGRGVLVEWRPLSVCWKYRSFFIVYFQHLRQSQITAVACLISGLSITIHWYVCLFRADIVLFLLWWLSSIIWNQAWWSPALLFLYRIALAILDFLVCLPINCWVIFFYVCEKWCWIWFIWIVLNLQLCFDKIAIF